jgi:hypothetical protein
LASESGESARARLIETRRGTWVDKSLFPEARRECLEILRQVARDAEGKGIFEMLRGERKRLNDYPLGDVLRSMRVNLLFLEWLDSHHLNWAALVLLAEELGEYRIPEEDDAWVLAVIEARRSAKVCGCCGREMTSQEPAYFGAEVYVGMRPLRWNMVDRPRICEPRYERTVLCESCAPEWLSLERDDVIMQLCAHCERPMVSRLELSELRRTLCSDPCRRAYQNQVRKEKRAEERKKVCEVCGEEFTGTRRDQKTCSDGCRQKAYRRRRKEAQQDR